MQDRETVAFGLDTMAGQIENWLKWDREHRCAENLTTDDGTHIMSLPVPFWPSHGSFTAWVKTMREAAAIVRG